MASRDQLFTSTVIYQYYVPVGSVGTAPDYSGQSTLPTQSNQMFCVKVTHRRRTAVSLEADPIYCPVGGRVFKL